MSFDLECAERLLREAETAERNLPPDMQPSLIEVLREALEEIKRLNALERSGQIDAS